MNKIKIKLTTPELVNDFVNICSKYDCDINVYDGRVVLDGKSIIAMFSIMQGKSLEVQVISSEEDVISKFIADMRKFEV